MNFKLTLKKYTKLFINGTYNMFKELFNKDLRKNQIANIISFQRLILPLIIMPITIIGTNILSIPLLVSSMILTTLGALTDMIDGKVARFYNLKSEYGKFLDQITDKFFSGTIAITLSLINPMFLIPVIFEVLIASINTFYKSKYKNMNIKSSMLGKIKQWPLSITMILGILSPINNITFNISKIAITITSLFQSATAIDYLIREYKESKKIDNQKDKKINLTKYKNTNENNNNKKVKQITYNNTKIVGKENAKVKVKVKKKDC